MNSKKFSILFSLIVFLSGIAGLSYELLWIRTIKGYFGSELYSVSLVVSIYFAGIGLGGLIGSRLLKRGVTPLKLYAVVEALLALFGLLFPLLIQGVHAGFLSLSTIVSPALWLVIKGVLTASLLIIPTTLIGITLPVIAAVVVYQADVFTTRFSRFYGLNTFGAVIGCLLVGFLLIPQFGLLWAGRIIVLINIIVSLLCFISDMKNYTLPSQDVYHSQPWQQTLLPGLIAFLMGFLSLTFEVVWFRIFAFYFVSSAASLALLLCVFLVGLALGSVLLSLWKKKVTIQQLAFLEFSKALFMIASFLLVRYIFFHGWENITAVLLENNSFANIMKYNFFFALAAFLLPAILMGMTFPLLERTWPSQKAGSAHVVGVMSAWNTWGGTIGAGAAGLVLIPWLGSSATLFLAIAVSMLVAVLLFFKSEKKILAPLPIVIVLPILFLLPQEMNQKRQPSKLPTFEYYHEGRGSSVSVFKNKFGQKTLYVGNAYVLGGTGYKTNIIQGRQGALANILSPGEDKKVLKIGLGTGVTFASLATAHGVVQADAVEIVPQVIQILDRFEPDNQFIRSQEHVRIHEGDGREFMATSQEKFDVILGELYAPQFAGTGNLYSIEHFRNIKKHLADDGVFCQGLHLAHSQKAFRIIVRSFLEVFESGSLWVINMNVQEPVVILVAGVQSSWSIDELERGIAQYDSAYQDYLGWTTAQDIAAHFVTNDLESVTAGENRINSINNPWIEEIAPRDVHAVNQSPLAWFNEYREWPDFWSNWRAGRAAWAGFGRCQMAALSLQSGKKHTITSVQQFLNIVENTMPIRTLDLYKSEIYMTLVENVIMKQNVLKNTNQKLSVMTQLTERAVELDPANYIYRFNLWNLYMMTKQTEKAKTEYNVLEKSIPPHLKTAPALSAF